MEKKEFLERCAKRYQLRANLSHEQAMEFAEACWDEEQAHGTDLTPEESADMDMSYWSDDGEQ